MPSGALVFFSFLNTEACPTEKREGGKKKKKKKKGERGDQVPSVLLPRHLSLRAERGESAGRGGAARWEKKKTEDYSNIYICRRHHPSKGKRENSMEVEKRGKEKGKKRE